MADVVVEPLNEVGITSFCPNCGANDLQEFYRAARIPVHSVLVFDDRKEALGFPQGNIALAFCRACSFITNLAFDPAMEKYGPLYEATQAYSPIFNKFHEDLARSLIERYDLRGKKVLEIGCGQGEFLSLLCELGNNTGVGFDPAFREGESLASSRMNIVADFYSEKYSSHGADFVCCKQTLEHIPDTLRFVSMARAAIGDRPNTRVFFQVPDVARILHETAFWDIYYEHCSYFCSESLRIVFERSGFEVLASRTEYDGQYLMIEARPTTSGPAAESRAAPVVAGEIDRFGAKCRRNIKEWRRVLSEIHSTGGRVLLWGGGSKAVAFLTTLGVERQIECVVDINPRKWGTFLAGTGHRVIGPESLASYQPDIVIVMNPVYMPEIRRTLDGMGVQCQVMAITDLARRLGAGSAKASVAWR